MKYRYFTGFNENSKFIKLSGDIQRAIETQANIDLLANKISKYYGKPIQDDEIEEKLFNEFCEQYASKDEKELKKLVILDSKILYLYPLTKDRIQYYEDKAKEKAEFLDTNVAIQIKNHFMTNKKGARL